MQNVLTPNDCHRQHWRHDAKGLLEYCVLCLLLMSSFGFELFKVSEAAILHVS